MLDRDVWGWSGMEYSFIMLKPDAVERGVYGEVLDYFGEVGLRIPFMTRVVMTPELVDAHYSDVSDEARENLHAYMDGRTVVPALTYGEDAMERTRAVVGEEWRPEENPHGTVRGDVHNPRSALYSTRPNYHSRVAAENDLPAYNLIHAADPVDGQDVVAEEAELFFGEDIHTYLNGQNTAVSW